MKMFAGKPMQELAKLRKDSEERVRLIQIRQTLTQRLTLVFGTKMHSDDHMNQQVNSPSKANGHTEQFDRVLILWLDLQKAIARVPRKDSETPTVPWNCEDGNVSRIWESITRPENMRALVEWLCQSASGEPEIWALQALQECQLRSEEKH